MGVGGNKMASPAVPVSVLMTSLGLTVLWDLHVMITLAVTEPPVLIMEATILVSALWAKLDQHAVTI